MEEPLLEPPGSQARLEIVPRAEGLAVLAPHLPAGLSERESIAVQQELLDEFLADWRIDDFVLWYYTPMALQFTDHLVAQVVVYDCMDELSAFRGAPPNIRTAEDGLLAQADLVFTGGQSLYEAKKHTHDNIHAFPSSIDADHFKKARNSQIEPEDQQHIPRPRIGYAGVIDERLDVELLAKVAELRPDWHWVMVGPVAKVREADLPQGLNVHYLGRKRYQDLPAYLSGWDIGMLPFARNESTRYISPTKTPEYLAAGLPVISTSIADVVSPYGEQGWVEIADDPADFVKSCERLLEVKGDASRLRRTDAFLSQNSWDVTWSRMRALLEGAIELKKRRLHAGASAVPLADTSQAPSV